MNFGSPTQYPSLYRIHGDLSGQKGCFMKPTGMCKGQQQDEDVFLRVLLCQSYQTTAIRRILECANDLKPQKLNIPEPEIDNDSAELWGCN